MSVLADYHGPRTRSRALSIHQTSVYLGTAGGAVSGGFLGERIGWRSPFWILGLAGIAVCRRCWVLSWSSRPASRTSVRRPSRDRRRRRRIGTRAPHAAGSLAGQKVGRIVTQSRRPRCCCACSSGRTSSRRRFWRGCRLYIFERFDLGLANSSLTSTFWPLASLPGALLGGVAGRLGRRAVARAAGSGCRAWG